MPVIWIPVPDGSCFVDKKELKFTNLDKYYWKKEKITKRDTIDYYHQIAPFILPYLKNRPQSLNRHPEGAGGMNFYQKDVTGKVPPWVKTHDYLSESDGEIKKFFCLYRRGQSFVSRKLGMH